MKTRMILEGPMDNYSKPYDKYDYVAITIVTLLALLLGCCNCRTAHAEPINPSQAVQAILGEALHDEVSINAMAHALRNRGNLRGVYGVRVDRRYSLNLRTLALKTWFMSLRTPDVTKGATHWLSDYDLSHCKPSRTAWRFKMKETLYQGQTHYYKET